MKQVNRPMSVVQALLTSSFYHYITLNKSMDGRLFIVDLYSYFIHKHNYVMYVITYYSTVVYDLNCFLFYYFIIVYNWIVWSEWSSLSTPLLLCYLWIFIRLISCNICSLPHMQHVRSRRRRRFFFPLYILLNQISEMILCRL